MKKLSIQEKFEEFHQNNPQVYEELVRLSIQAVDKGRRKIGMKMLCEVVRWNVYMKTTDANYEFKICNNYTSRYARLLMKNNPRLAGIFEIRGLTS